MISMMSLMMLHGQEYDDELVDFGPEFLDKIQRVTYWAPPQSLL